MGEKILNSPAMQHVTKVVTWLMMLIIALLSYSFNQSVNRITELEKRQREDELISKETTTELRAFQQYQKAQNEDMKHEFDQVHKKLDLIIMGK